MLAIWILHFHSSLYSGVELSALYSEVALINAILASLVHAYGLLNGFIEPVMNF